MKFNNEVETLTRTQADTKMELELKNPSSSTGNLQAEGRLGLEEKVEEPDKLEIKTESTGKEHERNVDTTHKSNLS